jgi:hypothetical protein
MNKLIKAARALIERWETPLWKDAPATAGFIHALRDAVAEHEAFSGEPVGVITRGVSGATGVYWHKLDMPHGTKLYANAEGEGIRALLTDWKTGKISTNDLLGTLFSRYGSNPVLGGDPARMSCPACKGSGDSASGRTPCGACEGTGGVSARSPATADKEQQPEPVGEVQWRNIKHVVRTLADWAFGSKDDPTYGTCWIAVVNGLTAKDGPEFKLEPLYTHSAPADKDGERLIRAVQAFRNLPMLGNYHTLRATPEYDELCNAWDAAVDRVSKAGLRKAVDSVCQSMATETDHSGELAPFKPLNAASNQRADGSYRGEPANVEADYIARHTTAPIAPAPDKWFPLLGTGLAMKRSLLNERQAQLNHSQTLDVLASRGGLCPVEAMAVMESRSYSNRDQVVALRALIEASTNRDVDSLAQFIRSINGRNLLGAASLAEKIIEWQDGPRHGR